LPTEVGLAADTERMTNWLTNWEEARTKPVRTIATMTVSVFVSLALVDYYLAGTHSVASASGVGGVCAVMAALLACRGLWPRTFDRPLTSRGQSRVGRAARRWYYVVGCLSIALALIVYGVSVGSAGVAASGIPFLAIAVGFGFAKRWIRINRPEQ
jgi:hypothetical protein